MIALILNSGLGHRMGVLTSEHPKCMTEIGGGETILSRQLRLLAGAGVTDVVMTTGYHDEVLRDYCTHLGMQHSYTFVKNPDYAGTNYIYSIYCARKHLRDGDILLMHGDMVFEARVLDAALASTQSCMVVSSAKPLPEKDFKAIISDGRIRKIGVDLFQDAVAAQPLYKLKKDDWTIWLNAISAYCENGRRGCYAEDAFNGVSDDCAVYGLDVKDELCAEIDTPEDLAAVSKALGALSPEE